MELPRIIRDSDQDIVNENILDLLLIDRWLAGENNAFEELINRYRKRIYYIVYRFVGNPTEAEDLSQDVFVRLYQKIKLFNRTSTFYTWLYRLTINVCLNYRNKGYNRMESCAMVELPELGKTQSGKQDFDIDLQTAISKLPKQQRIVFQMKTYDDLKYIDIAQVLECSVGGAKANYFHAIKKLKLLLKDYSSSGEDE